MKALLSAVQTLLIFALLMGYESLRANDYEDTPEEVTPLVWEANDKIILDLDDNERISLSKVPGRDNLTCKLLSKNKDLPADMLDGTCGANSWPDSSAKVVLHLEKSNEKADRGKLKPVVKTVPVNDYYGRKVMKRYVQVDVEYEAEVDVLDPRTGRPTGRKETKTVKSTVFVAEEDVIQEKANDLSSDGFKDLQEAMAKEEEERAEEKRQTEAAAAAAAKPPVKGADSTPVKPHPIEPPCPPPSSGQKNPRDLKNLNDKVKPKPPFAWGSDVEAITKALEGEIGQCTFEPPLRDPKQLGLSSSDYDDKAIYLENALGKLNVSRAQKPQIKNALKRNLTRDELVDIDVMARTMYSEMSACFQGRNDESTLQYPLAIARVSVNRSEYVEDKWDERAGMSEAQKKNPPYEFFRADKLDYLGGEKTPTLSRVLLAPSQYSVWNPRIYDAETKQKEFNWAGLQQALCPPNPTANHYWRAVEDKQTGKMRRAEVPDFEKEIWEESRKIAVESVLFPDKFKERTQGINEFYYTSGDVCMGDRARVQRKVNERGISRSHCLNIFAGPPEDRLLQSHQRNPKDLNCFGKPKPRRKSK